MQKEPQKPIHMAVPFKDKLGVTALCFDMPREIDPKKGGATSSRFDVTCKWCKKKMDD